MCDHNHVNGDWNNDVIEAAKNSKVECLSKLIQFGADVNVREGKSHHTRKPKGKTALIYAVEKKDLPCVKLLLKAGADLNAQDLHRTPLICAALEGSLECLKILIEAGADVNYYPPVKFNQTVLGSAVGSRNLDCVDLLLKSGADVNQVNCSKITALMRAGDIRDHVCVDRLLKAGADVNIIDKKGLTVLYHVDTFKCLKLLLDAGADMNFKDKSQINPLFHFATTTEPACIDALIEAGADVNARDRRGFTTLFHSARNYNEVCVKSLIKGGADVNVADNGGRTPLHYAAFHGSDWAFWHPDAGPKVFSVIQFLLKSGAHVNKTDDKENNALHKHLKMSRPPNKQITMLLYAAGEAIDVDNGGDKFVPKKLVFLRNLIGSDLCLKDICRTMIRIMFLKLDPHSHLFDRIPKLGLPSVMTEYLLYGMSLDCEYNAEMEKDNAKK